MLEARHILRLMINKERLTAHSHMPTPSYVKKPLTGQFTSIGEATIGELFSVPPDIFQMQLEAARDFGASFVMQDKAHRVIGVSATTSLINSGDIMHKNMILPKNLMRISKDLDAHYLISVFIRGKVVDGIIPCVSEVEIAGWTSASEIAKTYAITKPQSFVSKLSTVMIPCTKLNPIMGLTGLLNETRVFV